MDDRIVRIDDSRIESLYVRRIYGLNAGRANHAELPDDPMLSVIHELTAAYSCSVHVGLLALEGHEPEEVFGIRGQELTYFETKVGIYGGTFYTANTGKAGLFFPDSNNALNTGKRKDLLYFLTSDALAILVEPHADSALTLLDNGIPSISDGREYCTAGYPWIHEMLQSCGMVVVTKGDGGHFTVYATTPEVFEKLTPAVTKAVTAIQGSMWYRSSQSNLHWDAEWDMCLVPRQP